MAGDRFDIVIPVYNEGIAVVRSTIAALEATFRGNQPTIIIVDDGSDKSFGLDSLANDRRITFVQHSTNRGYGAALKTGILSGTGEIIGIIDADGTYPVAEFPTLLQQMENQDMVIGVRTGKVREIPWLRRFPKRMLNILASYMSGSKISDLNSGMRIFRRDLAYYLWNFFPTGFSFTSTITMGAIMGGFRIKEQSINYYKREGQSSIHPIKDTVRFFRLICRLGLIFYPMKIFYPVTLLLIAAGLAKGIKDYLVQGYLGNLSSMLLLTAVQVFMVGLIGKLIVHSRFLRPPQQTPSKDAVRGTVLEVVPANKPDRLAVGSNPQS
jgi:glycosyltransferase involved in cell wall biosynthesis